MTPGLWTRTAGRLAVAVLAASLVVALLEAVMIAMMLGTVLGPLPDAVSAARAAGQPLTLAVVELADVATTVDLLGRRRTEVLVCAAATTLGAAGTGYRLSGETFAVVLPGVGPDAAFEVVDGLLAELTRAAAPLSAGAGLATLDARCPDAQMLLVGACAALDEARSLGANRVVASAEPGSGLRWLATPGHPAA